MTQRKPPAVASWMLRHLVPGSRNEAPEGDPLEEFHRRRRAAWYWRQVAGAIFAGFSTELHADRAMARTRLWRWHPVALQITPLLAGMWAARSGKAERKPRWFPARLESEPQ